MKKIYITSEIKEVHGGLTASLLNKVRILSTEKRMESIILTFNFDPNYPSIIKNIKDKYGLNDQVSIININQYFQSQYANKLAEKEVYDMNISMYDRCFENNNGQLEFYSEGILQMKRKIKDGIIIEDEFFNETSNLIKKNIYDNHGCLSMTSHYCPPNNNVSQQIIYRQDGKAILSRVFDTTKKTIKAVQYFPENGEVKKFSDFNSFKRYFILNEMVKKEDVILVVEARGQDAMVMEINEPYVRKVYMTHSIHIRPETDIIRAGNRVVLNNLNNIDGVVFLTHKQKRDVIKRFGNRSNYYVIPHSINITNNQLTTKKTNVVTMLSRLHEEKRISDAIRAFEIVVKKIPDAILNIYGDGAEKNKLNYLISELNLKEHVYLLGHTDKPAEVLNSAKCSVLTSSYEGFGMVIQESLAQGTPVVAYDIKYGPSDMIEHDKTGYLASNGNISEIAEGIIKILSLSDEKYQVMQKRAQNSMLAFSSEKFTEKWCDLFENIENKNRVNIEEVTFKLTKVISEKNCAKIQIQTMVIGNKTKIDVEKIKFTSKFYLRSTLDNKETSEFINIPMRILKSNGNSVLIECSIDFSSFNINEIYDLFISAQYKTFYLEKRVGNNHNENLILENKKRFFKTFIPYFTHPYNNLSFKYGK